MADPFFVIARTLTLTSAVRQSADQVRSLYMAPSEIDRIRSEVDSLESLLEAVRAFAQCNSARHTNHFLMPSISLAQDRIASVNSILTSPAFGLRSLSDTNQARATYFRYSRRLATLELELKDSVQKITVGLVFATASESRNIGDVVNLHLTAQKDSSERIVHDVDQLLIKHLDTARSKNLIQTRVEMTQLKMERWRQTNDSTQILPMYSKTTSENKRELQDLSPESLRKRDNCRSGCNCFCHINRELKTPLSLQQLLGALRVYWRFQRPQSGCNCPENVVLAVSYHFPHYLLERYLTLVMQTTYMAGPEFVLRVPRVLPWTHSLWRYSVCGDLLAIKRMYSNKTASPFDVDPSGRNALLYASKQKNVQVAHFLLDQGTDSNQSDNLGRPPSDNLLRRSFGGLYGHSGNDLTRRLLNGDDSKAEFGFKQLHQIVLGFLKKDMETILCQTTETIELTDALGRTPLFWAVICDNPSYVELLLSYKASPNAKDLQGCTPLDFVRGPVVCQLLLTAGATVNINSRHWHHSSIHEHVIEHGSADVISVFSEWGFDIDIRDDDDETPLLNAIYAGSTSVAQRLIELGANVNNANKSSYDSALHFAAQFDRPAILQMLLDKHANYNALECNGRNLAHCAAMKAGTVFINIMASANLDQLDLSLKDKHGMRANDYMQERELLSDREVGLHEAWEDFVVSIPAPPPYVDEPRNENPKDVFVEYERGDAGLKIPGAFPTVTVEEFAV